MAVFFKHFTKNEPLILSSQKLIRKFVLIRHLVATM